MLSFDASVTVKKIIISYFLLKLLEIFTLSFEKGIIIDKQVGEIV